MIWDFDSTLLNVHSEKEDAAATYKRGFGFNPLGGVVRQHQRAPGRHACARATPPRATPTTTSNSSSRWSAPCRPSTHSATKKVTTPPWCVHPILVRADSAGASHRFVQSLSDRQLRLLDWLSHQRFCA